MEMKQAVKTYAAVAKGPSTSAFDKPADPAAGERHSLEPGPRQRRLPSLSSSTRELSERLRRERRPRFTGYPILGAPLPVTSDGRAEHMQPLATRKRAVC